MDYEVLTKIYDCNFVLLYTIASRSGVKGRSAEKSFTWTDDLTKTLLFICRKYHEKHGYQHPFIWHEICDEFTCQTRKICPYSVPKNKFESMKILWRLWRSFWTNEMECICDPVTGQIFADDLWWDKKLKVNARYNVFRKRGVIPEITRLWNDVFGPMVSYPKLFDFVGLQASANGKPAGMFKEEDYGLQRESTDDDCKIVEHESFDKLRNLSLGLKDESVLSTPKRSNIARGKTPISLGVSEEEEEEEEEEDVLLFWK
ncbi:hypothetical protein V2J09_001014 [Rumex salicifolius]